MITEQRADSDGTSGRIGDGSSEDVYRSKQLEDLSATPSHLTNAL